MHRVLDEQFVQPGRGLPAVLPRTGHEERPELVPELAERLEVRPRDAVAQVLAVGDECPQSVERAEHVATLMPEAVGVHEPHREFGVGGKVHSRVLAAGEEGVMGWCRY